MGKEKNIGLSLSGGGHRATVFALGALLYIVDSGRNKAVTTISSVSGGSITNAFVATLSQPFNKVSPEYFEREVARLAKQIAGSWKWWWSSWITYICMIILWIILTFKYGSFPGSLLSSRQLLFLPPLLIWAVCIGPRSGGTLWKWWGTWLYVGIMLPALVVTLTLLWTPIPLGYRLLLLAAVGSTALLRNKVAELAFDATLCSPPAGSRLSSFLSKKTRNLASLPTDIRHVFCTTELHTGRHAYFSNDLVYIPFAGIGDSACFRLSTAVQTSANFPGGFPFRFLLLRSKHRFVGEKLWLPERKKIKIHHVKLAAFTDGGVYDNTATSWFLEADERPDELHNIDRLVKNLGETLNQGVLDKLRAMKPELDQLLVLNSSEPAQWRYLSKFLVPVVSELSQLLGITDVLYNNRGYKQARDMQELFFSKVFRQRLQGAMVCIGEQPWFLAKWIADPDSKILEGRYSKAERIDDYIHAAAKKQWNHWQFGLDFEQRQAKMEDISRKLHITKEELSHIPEKISVKYIEKEREIMNLEFEYQDLDPRMQAGRALKSETTHDYARKSKFIRTTLRPLGHEVVAGLLWHGYYQTMMNGNLLLDGFPLMEPFPPLIEDFKALARGYPRSHIPKVHQDFNKGDGSQ